MSVLAALARFLLSSGMILVTSKSTAANCSIRQTLPHKNLRQVFGLSQVCYHRGFDGRRLFSGNFFFVILLIPATHSDIKSAILHPP